MGSPVFTPDVRRMLPHLAVSMQARGSHAWGGTNGDQVIRHLGPIIQTWHSEQAAIEQWEGGIFHTRMASCGASGVLENAHPFSAQKPDGSWVRGIHNGCLSNHTELNRVHNRSCSVDSEHLWIHRAAGVPWNDINGYANLAWYETQEGVQNLLIAKINSCNLYCCRVADGGLVFASTREAIDNAAAITGSGILSTVTLEEGQVYRLSGDGVWETGEEVAFRQEYRVSAAEAAAGRAGSAVGFTSGGGGSSYRPIRRPGNCQKCNKISDPLFLLCEECFKQDVAFFQQKFPATPAIVAAAAAVADGTGDSTDLDDGYVDDRISQMIVMAAATGGGLTEDQLEELEATAYGWAQ